MTVPAIRVEGLGKRYRLAHGQEAAPYRTLRDSIMNMVTSPFQKRGTVEEFWALNDVSFEVQPGEVVGIIGRNGAGKSTLLKILSRITKPTKGRVEINGRVGSLLEVGTGFHPELTGRENIYLNGSILGMSRREIEKNFDEIVAFAEVEKFLDTPVKRYSSGMYVRLAFAVAAHLEPEILIVDEVLAVGDGSFQKKCLGKMGEVAANGRTVLLVTHQLDAVKRLCRTGVLLENGRLRLAADSNEVLEQYLQSGPDDSNPNIWINLKEKQRIGEGGARFAEIQYSGDGSNGYPCSDGMFETTIRIESNADRVVSSFSLIIYDRHNTKLINAEMHRIGQDICLRQGITEVKLFIDSLHLIPGTYVIGLWLANPPLMYDFLQEAFLIEVLEQSLTEQKTNPIFDGLVTCNFRIEVS